MRIAIIGGGVSGLVAASLLARRHDVTIFEAGSHAGGHTNTVHLTVDRREYAVDTGFIVFNHRTYPLFTRLLERLGVATAPTTMSFSVRCERSGVEYCGSSLNGLFAQRRNLVRPSFHRMVLDILRFNRRGPGQVERLDGATVGEFLGAHGYGRAFREHYLVPMGASIWSCPPRRFLEFPVRFVMDFFRNHAMLQVQGRPVWRVVRGGSARYVEALTRPFARRIRLNTPVERLRRLPGRVEIATRTTSETFDEAVVACHSDQALGLLADADETERALLGAFPYQENEAVLHTDTTMLPSRRGAWAAWNYRIPSVDAPEAAVTYNLNLLQRIDSPRVFCVSLNANGSVSRRAEIARFTYHHPLYTTRRDEAQRRHREVIRRRRTSYCGAYWGYGFHEDGVRSAVAVARAFGEEL